jgi:hypothetical protein
VLPRCEECISAAGLLRNNNVLAASKRRAWLECARRWCVAGETLCEPAAPERYRRTDAR